MMRQSKSMEEMKRLLYIDRGRKYDRRRARIKLQMNDSTSRA
jgi:hypothetical protein